MKSEIFYQKFLENHLSGAHCKLPYGETDITTDTIHAEIKIWGQWKSAFGQLIYYNHVCPKDDLRIYLYGNKPNSTVVSDITSFLKSYNIRLFILTSDADTITITDADTDMSETFQWDVVAEEVTPLDEETKEVIKAALSGEPNVCKIDLDVVADWLDVQKIHLKKTLLYTYKQHIDYNATLVTNKRGRGRRLEKIMLTSNCFKFLCMRSNTARAQMIRALLC